MKLNIFTSFEQENCCNVGHGSTKKKSECVQLELGLNAKFKSWLDISQLNHKIETFLRNVLTKNVLKRK